MLEQIFGPVLIVGSINFIQVFWSFVQIKKLKDFFPRNNTVKIAVNEENGHVAVDFFEDIQVVDFKDITLDFLDGFLFDKKEERLDEKRG